MLIAVAAVIVFNISLSRGSGTFPNLTLANIEALAQNNESGNGRGCTIMGYTEVWSNGCLYYCAWCAEGHYQALYVVYCVGR